MNQLFASTSRGIEELLKAELLSLSAQHCKIAAGGVYFEATHQNLYRILLESRLASRLFLPIKTFQFSTKEQFDAELSSIRWDKLFNADSSFVVNVTGSNDVLRHSHYAALCVKDAVVDYFSQHQATRPNIEKTWPDIRLHLYIQRNQAVVSLDLSGEALHQRGYRRAAGEAPLKENLAAAMLVRSGWVKGTPLVDPFCGSGTLLIEAALMASKSASGLLREHWGFLAWKGHQPELWHAVRDELQQVAAQGKQACQARFYGYDHDSRVIALAKDNAMRAGVAHLIHFECRDITELSNPYQADEVGTLISNPPYGERLESELNLIALYTTFGSRMKSYFQGWNASVLSASVNLLDYLALRASKQIKVKNGPLDCVQKNYSISSRLQASNGTTPAVDKEQMSLSLSRAQDFANRLQKNVTKIVKWAQREAIDCYRLYDADLPDYNVAIDRYAEYVVVQEYAPPKTIPDEKRRQRLFDLINVTQEVLGLPTNRVILKQRERQKGKKQYQRLAKQGTSLVVNEYGAKFEVNLTDYLDTGLFLDHRLVRKKIAEFSRGKRFLNLFAYTGSATVQAARGGARSSVSVDMSLSYLEWAERNLALNGFEGREHRLVQADCLQWLAQCQEKYDLILLDPPTFSNSKRMEHTFDVQRDHLAVLSQLKKILSAKGTIFFSNNRQGFKLDEAGLTELGLHAHSITQQTQSFDFQRHTMHQCWLISHITA